MKGTMIKTFRFRLKSRNLSYLKNAKNDVNFVWNYCNETSVQYLDKKDKWLSGYDLGVLTKNCSKDLLINSQSIQAICQEYARRRSQFRKRKLSWRSKNRSLGWIPFNGQTIEVGPDSVLYKGISFRFWNSRAIEGKIKSGSFNQDSKGHWFVSFICEVNISKCAKSNHEVGIDLGLKTIATLSNGESLNRENITEKYGPKLAVAQRAKKKKRVTSIHLKIKNVRKDWNHKHTTKLVRAYGRIVVGDVSPSKLKKTRMAKAVSDAGWADFKSMLAYKAAALGVEYKEINENFSTVTCSTCFERTGPRGLSALGVREWVCMHCGTTHKRDVNAAKNIFRFGCEAPIKGSLFSDTSKMKEMKKETSNREEMNQTPEQ